MCRLRFEQMFEVSAVGVQLGFITSVDLIGTAFVCYLGTSSGRLHESKQIHDLFHTEVQPDHAWNSIEDVIRTSTASSKLYTSVKLY